MSQDSVSDLGLWILILKAIDSVDSGITDLILCWLGLLQTFSLVHAFDPLRTFGLLHAFSLLHAYLLIIPKTSFEDGLGLNLRDQPF